MATTIKLYITVSDIAEVAKLYDRARVYRSTTGVDGTYTELTTAATRIPLEPGVPTYTFYDHAAEITYWYKTDFYNSENDRASLQSDPQLGDDGEVISGVMTVDQLKSIYLTGIDLTDDRGNAYPDIMYEFGIRAAIARVEHELDIYVRPTVLTEPYDYDQMSFRQWGFLQLDHYPVISVEYVKMRWPTTSDPYEFPSDWIRLEPKGGQINLVPTSGTIAQALIVQGAILPTVLYHTAFIPGAIEVKYTAGFAAGALPYDIRDLIGMFASFPIFNTAGDLIAGAGIANYSISIDGLSQSVGTTSSATNSGYGARLVQYNKQIKEALPVVRKFYKNVGLQVA